VKLRQSNIERLDVRDYDVLIVGGGINGAVSASSLTSRGAKVALIDRADFAGYTSQESSNLVWGGIKYLETYEFGLVRKLCVSRNRLLRAYPSNVREIRFMASLAKGFRKSRFLVWAGSLLYWFMGSFFTRRPRLLSTKAIKAREPDIDATRIAGGVEYSDAYLVDNDARFVFRFVREALDHGGICANYVEATGSTFDGTMWTTTAKDLITGRELTIRSRVVVNACGPFVDERNARDAVTTDHTHLYSKGIHLITRRITASAEHATAGTTGNADRRVLAFFASDGRLFFVIPLGARSCIGTTDTRVGALPPVVTEEDRHFVLDNINALMALEEPLTVDDIIAERCGVRPLVVDKRGGGKKDDGDWTSLSRKHAIDVDSAKKHISIYGGKLTDCINVGDEVASAVRELGVEYPYPKYRWYGEPSADVRAEFFHRAELMGLDAMTHPDSSERLSTRLWRRYQGAAQRLLEDIRIDPRMGELLIEGTEYIRAEIQHTARTEMVTKLEDFLRRRSKIALVAKTEVIRSAPGLMEACRIFFGDEAQARYDEYFAGLDDPGHGKRGLAIP
jgi:glycerol-3-phosphate dehydrogenase